MNNDRRRVVVTGIGLLSPCGLSVDESWQNIVNGVSGIGPITAFDATDYDSRIAGEVNNFDPLNYMDKKEARRTDRSVQLAIAASVEAMKDIDTSKIDTDRFGVIIGSGIGGIKTFEDQHAVLMKRGPGKISPFFIPMMISDMAAGQISIRYGLRGPNFGTVSACASGGHAISDSYMYVKNGYADMILTGGTEATICPMAVGGFCSMKALSTRNDEPEKASRPFDKMRDGFVMAEGAGIVILETLTHAKKRNASKIYAEIIGAGMSCDAYHITAPDPEGEGATISMKNSLIDAKISADDVDYINAHGTSTKLNDKSETFAIKKVYGKKAYDIPVSSNKSMIGHLLGAAGAVEFISTCLTVKNDIIPPTINYEFPDPECDLDYVPNKARKKEVNIAISNSFGFGGHNVTLVVKKFLE